MSAPTYKFDGWEFRIGRRELVDPQGVIICLTTAEFDLLRVLCDNPQESLSRAFLVTKINQSYRDEQSINVSVCRLRKKLDEADPNKPKLIKTIRLGGFWFTPDVEIVG